MGNIYLRLQPSPFTLLALSFLIGLIVARPSDGLAHTTTPKHETTIIQEESIALPVGETVFKIGLTSEGIYEIDREALLDLGLPPNTNPQSLQLMHYGQPVAYQLVNDNGDEIFDTNEKIRFYGWPFDESRAEKLYVTENIFWLIPGQEASHIEQSPVVTDGALIDQTDQELRFEVDDAFSSVRIQQNSWDTFGVDPDHFFWLELVREVGSTSTEKSLTIDLPNPVDTIAAQATIAAHMVVRNENRNLYGNGVHGKLKLQHENLASSVSEEFGVGSVFTLTQSLPNNTLNDGVNEITFTNSIPGGYSDTQKDRFSTNLYVNYLTVNYLAELKANGNQLIFTHSASGNRRFQVSQLDKSDPDKVIAWEIGDRRSPTGIAPTYLSGAGSNHSHQIGFEMAGEQRFIVATESAVRSVDSLRAYTPESVEPASGGAQWVAIAYGDFAPAAQTLAAHRSAFSHLNTAVYDVEDIVNQYGYGFPSSMAIKRYVQHAYDEWEVPIEYLLLVGDAHFNPRHLDCSQCFKETEVNFIDFSVSIDSLVPIGHSYADDIQGLISSDYDYTLLEGDDLIADIAVGRLSVETVDQVNGAVQKIITYESNLVSSAEWQKELLFLHDLSGFNEAFKEQSGAAASLVPDGYYVTIDGLNGEGETAALRERMFAKIASGVGILMWRGHGSVDTWSNAGEKVLQYSDFTGLDPLFTNTDKPFVSISFDCLDGHFALPGYDSISESLLRLDAGRGAAAHFSSSGLGFANDHAIMSNAFLSGMYSGGHTTIGNLINRSKAVYLETLSETSEVYSFNLQGDPAMALLYAEIGNYVTGQDGDGTAGPGDTINWTYRFDNLSGITAANHTRLQVTLPADLTFVSADVKVAGLNSEVINTNLDIRTGENGESVITLSFHDGSSASAGGGIIPSETIEITLETEVVAQPASDVLVIESALLSPGQAALADTQSISLGADAISLPLIFNRQ